MRRVVVSLSVLTALAVASAAGAALAPVKREFGELVLPRVRTGTPALPRNPAPSALSMQVLVRLRSAPLAAWSSRQPTRTRASRALNLRAPAARRYLAALAAEQEAAIEKLREVVPEARVERRFRILLNALTVTLPVRSYASLRRLRGVSRVYPSVRYSLALNRSPGVIGATQFSAVTGALGAGVKIAIVDDGIDPDNPFFEPATFAFPEGFPKGDRDFTSAKIIVARSFRAPGAGPAARLPFDEDASFHGTHVAGIAAGNAGVAAKKGKDHPRVDGLTGIAPRAWIGNYRVFSLPTPVGNVANTPEIVAAFEAALRDGMDVINFSGGGPEIEPANDALVETIANVAAAGVVPVIAAGNDRDDFGSGSIGSPGTASEAITVAAASNEHVFAPTLGVRAEDAPEALRAIPFQGAAGTLPPKRWSSKDFPLVDVTTLSSSGGQPVDGKLCSTGPDPNGPSSPLPARSLRGAIALVARGDCTFESKAQRAERAGAVGLVVIDNRPGEASTIPIELSLPALMIADLDGARLHDYLAAHPEGAPMRIVRNAQELATGRSGVVTSFSSQGPTDFEHALKPDLAAPGGQVLSSTARSIAKSGFAVFDGTSMATPHVAGAAALVLQRHPGWAPWQVKSALVSTAGRAFADTARTLEAPVTLGGGGLVDVGRADGPLLFERPASLSFEDLDVSGGPARRAQVMTISDAGAGAGSWSVEVRPQSATAGTSLEAPASVSVGEGGGVDVAIAAQATSEASTGENYGFVVLKSGDAERRVPYFFLVTRPELLSVRARRLDSIVAGTTRKGRSATNLYRYPVAPFGLAPSYTGQALVEDGAEKLFTQQLELPAVNLGVSLVGASRGAQIDPFLLGSADENDVQGLAGTPANVNGLTDSYRLPVGAAGASFPAVKRYYVAVDSPRDPFSNRVLSGRFVLRSWVDDLFPPTLEVLTKRLSSRHGLVAARALDFGAGVDPLSLTLAYGGTLLGATAYDPIDGLALFPIPREVSLDAGKNFVALVASDFQEAKNVNTFGANVFPNTGAEFETVRVDADRAAVTWLRPDPDLCVRRGERLALLVYADGPARIRSVRFFDGERLVAMDRQGARGLFRGQWRVRGKRGALHRLRAVARDAAGQEASARLRVPGC